MRKNHVVTIRLQPGAKTDKIIGWLTNGDLKIRIRQKPIKGKANQYLIIFLSKCLNLSKDRFELIFGIKSRQKRIRIWDIDEIEFRARINLILDQDP